MENRGSLEQIDITNKRPLPTKFLGTRIPLKYTPLIDMICDTKYPLSIFVFFNNDIGAVEYIL